MKKLLLTFGLLLPMIALAQGTAIRSFNGVGTNTVFYSNTDSVADMFGQSLLGGAVGFRRSVVWNARLLYDTLDTPSMDWDLRTFTGNAWIFLSITNHSDVSAGAFATGNVWGYDGLTGKWTNGPPTSSYTAPLLTNAITMNFDGGGAVIATNVQRFVTVPYNATIKGFYLLSDTTSTTVIEIMRCTFTQFDGGATFPTLADKITASLPPTITATKTNVVSVATWSGSITQGNVLAFRTLTNTASTTLSLTLLIEHAP